MNAAFSFSYAPGTAAPAFLGLAAAFNLSAATAVKPSPLLADAIAQVVAAKTKNGHRATYVTSLRQYLAAFEKRFTGRHVGDITTEDLEAWFNERGEPPNSRVSNAGRLGALFSFAMRRGWIDRSPVERLERPRITRGTPRILTVEECRKLLMEARKMPDMFPYIVLTLFAGIRPEEARKLRWEHVDLDRRLVRIPPEVSKVGRQRHAALPENAAKMLAPYHGKMQRHKADLCTYDRAAVRQFHQHNKSRKAAKLAFGISSGGTLHYLLTAPEPAQPPSRPSEKVCPPAMAIRRRIKRLRKVMGWPGWPQDILRHTAISYWMASTGNIGVVATSMGNSADMIQRHYHQLVAPDAAKEFFGLA